MSCNLNDRLVPRGVADYVGVDVQYINMVECCFSQVAQSWGYCAVRPAMFEYEDALLDGIDQGLHRKIFRIDDWQSGRMLALPPDITPQIARISATRLKNTPLPHRLSYAGRVIRHTESQSGNQRELYQVGAELIGDATLMGDVEVIKIALNTLKRLGFDLITLNLSHPRFAKGVFDSLGLLGTTLYNLKSAVSRKDRAELKSIISRIPLDSEVSKLLQGLPMLFGGVEVIAAAQKYKLPEPSVSALQQLQYVVDALCETDLDLAITVDLGDTRGLGYHNGVVFEGYSIHSAAPLFSGGRYDTLIQKYGEGAPATGVTCNTCLIASTLKTSGIIPIPTDKGIIVWGSSLEDKSVLKMIEYLQVKGYMVTVNRSATSFSDVISYAKLNNIQMVLTVSNKGLELSELENGKTILFSLKEYSDFLF